MSLRRLAFPLLLLLAGCHTGGPHEPPRVPAVLHPLFMPCVPTDGALAVQAYRGDGLLGTLDVEWVAKPTGDWDLEAMNAFGLTMLKVSRKGREITTQGQLAAKVPKLAVSPTGYLLINDERVGIKAAEVPCMLGFRLPRTWLDGVDAVEKEKDGKVLMTIDEKERDVDVTATGLQDGHRPATLCSRLSWRRYLVFKPALTWCQSMVEGASKPEAVLRGIDDYALKWVALDE